MATIHDRLHAIAERLEWLEGRTKPLFVGVALLLYGLSLVELLGEINLTTDLNAFLVEALANLSIPFGVILLQELLELVTSISHSTLISARRQFEIVVLVIVRSFFKNFAKVNIKVETGVFAEAVQESIVKVLAIVVMTALIIYFRRLSESRAMRSYEDEGRVFVIVLVGLVFIDLLLVVGSFEVIAFISVVFTGLIVVDALFLMLAILRDSQFDTIVFESALVISLIFARFPLFTSNTLAYSLSVLGVAFATISLYLLHRSRPTVPPESAQPVTTEHDG
jgi:hypothetical protein